MPALIAGGAMISGGFGAITAIGGHPSALDDARGGDGAAASP